MVMDTDDYISVANEPENVAIINPDNLEHGEADQLQDLPMANDRAYPRQYALPLPTPAVSPYRLRRPRYRQF
jgi:ubiquitin carboxyl-terminal hydrolase 7